MLTSRGIKRALWACSCWSEHWALLCMHQTLSMCGFYVRSFSILAPVVLQENDACNVYLVKQDSTWKIPHRLLYHRSKTQMLEFWLSCSCLPKTQLALRNAAPVLQGEWQINEWCLLTCYSLKFTVMGILKPHQTMCCSLSYSGLRVFFLTAKLYLSTVDTSFPFVTMTHKAVEWYHVFLQPSLL